MFDKIDQLKFRFFSTSCFDMMMSTLHVVLVFTWAQTLIWGSEVMTESTEESIPSCNESLETCHAQCFLVSHFSTSPAFMIFNIFIVASPANG